MTKVATYQSNDNLNPTPVDPAQASAIGGDVVDLGKGLEGIGEVVQKLQDRTQTLKAQTALAQAHTKNQEIALTDPDVFNLSAKIDQNTETSIQSAANLISSPSARNEFVSKAQLDSERRNASVYNTIYRRQSQDFKGTLLTANDQDIKEYQSLADPNERELMRKQITDRTNEAISNGYINPAWGQNYLKHTLKQADLDQVKNDMAVSAEDTYKQLQKGSEGLYPYLSESQRKQFSDQAEKQITKQGSENRLIYGIAQNHAENQLIDAMAGNQLNQEMVNNAQLMGINGIKIRPEFAKAATEALQDPFPTDSSSNKYLKLFNQVTDPEVDPIKAKLDVLKSRGVTPQQKAQLINGALRENPENGDRKESLDNIIKNGIQQNKQQIMELNKRIQKEVEEKRSFISNIAGMFKDHSKDDDHLASLQQQFMAKVHTAKDTQDMVDMANSIMNHDTIQRNPRISTADPKGTVFMDKTTGVKRIYYPDGHWEPLKNAR